ncbi:MAG: hypothetical protein H6839_00550 [Planctomycetes bacterium]|nr:hypothetical protein [Planctomycetota bacterium]
MDFKKLQDKLNQDQAFRKQFLADPASVLAAEGFVLSEDQKKQVAAVVEQLTKPTPAVAGSTIASSVNANEWKISIDIKIPI